MLIFLADTFSQDLCSGVETRTSNGVSAPEQSEILVVKEKEEQHQQITKTTVHSALRMVWTTNKTL